MVQEQRGVSANLVDDEQEVIAVPPSHSVAAEK